MQPSDNNDKKIRRNVRLVVVGVLVFSVISLGALMHKLSQPRSLNKYELQEYGAVILDEPRQLQEINLVDQYGKAFRAENLLGKWTIFFVGFTHCGDICPTTMAELAKTYAGLRPEEQEDFSIIFLTVDPDRDSPQVLGRYVASFDEDFFGVTGKVSELASLAMQLNLTYQPEGINNFGEPTHSGNLALVNPRGKLHGYFRPPLAHGSLRLTWRSLRNEYLSQ
jgi:protein SCO1